MRIAYLCNQYPAVSHSFIRREIAALEEEGHQVRRISIRPFSDNLADAADRNEAARTLVVLNRRGRVLLSLLSVAISRPAVFCGALLLALGMARAGSSGLARHLAYLAEACFIVRYCRLQQIDHLHAHFGTNPAAVARLARRLGGPCYSFTVHGPDEFDAPGPLDLAGKIADAAFIAAISDFGRAQLMRWSHPDHWRKIHVVRCGVDGSFLDQGAVPEIGGRRFACVARLSAQKGLPLLIDAAAILAAKGLEFELVVIGDGEMRDLLKRRISELALERHVRLAGSLDGEAIRRRLLDCRAFVLPSFAEGLPVSLMEALALGRPCIATSVAGVPELVDEGCGWLIPAGSLSALVAALEAVLDCEPSKLTRMGAEGRKRVADRHDVALNTQKLAALMSQARADRLQAGAVS